jgi:hypothetical protein
LFTVFSDPGDRDPDHPLVAGVAVALDQPLALQALDELRHGGLRHPFVGGERGEATGALVLEPGERQRGRETDVTRGARTAYGEPGELLQPRRHRGSGGTRTFGTTCIRTHAGKNHMPI